MNSIDDEKRYYIELEEVLTPKECSQLIGRIESLKPTIATINSTAGNRVDTRIRNNERVMFDDGQFAERLYADVSQFLPQEFAGRRICGVNERFRCYRYQPGMRFSPHSDGSFVRNEHEMSHYTFLIYLNDDFEGGETTLFLKPEIRIKPSTGGGLLFQHPLIHEGSVVKSGIKYVVRTDIMYSS